MLQDLMPIFALFGSVVCFLFLFGGVAFIIKKISED